LGRLGTGAMGRVYLGRSAAGRLVAVKTIKSEFADEADFRARFAHEVMAARRVSGVFTAAVVAADPEAEIPWLATAYVPAPSLDQVVRACGPLPVRALRWLAAGCAEALESIHQAGLVHRDLKPSNVLVSVDGPRVIDFGVARATEQMTLTASRQAVGTPAYMAPEQARDPRQTVRASDVFSLGSTLLFAATGHPPYVGDSVTDILVRLATEPPDLTGLPDELTDLVSGCLQRDPDARPTAAALLARLAAEMERDTGLGSGYAAPLPTATLALMEEYRHAPPPVALGDPRPAEEGVKDATLDSPTSSGRAHRSLIPHRLSALSLPSPRGMPGIGRGRRQTSARRGPRFGRVARVVALAALSVGTAAALLLLGGAIGGAFAGRPGAPRYGPPPGPPPDQVPTDSQSGSPRPTGKPRIALNQTFGDGNTGFVVHGAGLSPGQKIAIRLDNGHVSPFMPVVDFGGTFNYAINQNHEFFPGKLPPGKHQVAVTASGTSRQLGASFDVNNL
jgi:serine/threonine protein kinase